MSEENQEIRKLAAIMFTDMVGYSAIAQRNESLAIQMLEEHRSLLRPLFPKYGGREIETIGDAFFVEFGSAVEAVRCAVEMQHTLHERNQTHPSDQHLRIRIGIHLGDVIQKGSHVLGDGVNIAARLEPLAPPEGICISEDVARQVQNKLGIPLSKLGQKNLKNIQFPMEIYSVNLPWQNASGQPVQSLGMQQSSANHPSRAKKVTPAVWYAFAGLIALGAGAAYFFFNTRTQPPLDQARPTVVRETVRVAAPQVSQPPSNERTLNTKGKPVVQGGEVLASKNTIKGKKISQPTPSEPVHVNADSIFQRGLGLYRSGDLTSAQTIFNEALTHFRTARSTKDEAGVLLATARVLKHQDKLAAAQLKAEEAARLFTSLANKTGVAQCQVLLADILIEEGKAKEAESIAGQVVIAQPESDEAFVARALLAKAHAALENMEDALKQAQYFDEHQRRLDDMEWNAVIVATVVRVRAASRSVDRTQRRKQDYESEITRSGNIPAEFEGRLAYGELAMKYGKAAQIGRRRLESLKSDAAAKGFVLIARKAESLLR